MQRLSAYIAGALRKPLPAAVAEKTKHHLLDTLAAMVSGSRLRPGKEAISFARSHGGGKDAFVHISAVERAGLDRLVEGQRVEFELVPDPRSGKVAAEKLKKVG